jgi:hypothetical protein
VQALAECEACVPHAMHQTCADHRRLVNNTRLSRLVLCAFVTPLSAALRCCFVIVTDERDMRADAEDDARLNRQHHKLLPSMSLHARHPLYAAHRSSLAASIRSGRSVCPDLSRSCALRCF